MPKPISFYLDLDGLLADFAEGVERLGHPVTAADNHSREFLLPVQQAAKDARTLAIARAPSFYAGLQKCELADALWSLCAPYGITVLTAVPGFENIGLDRVQSELIHEDARRQKLYWSSTQFAPVPKYFGFVACQSSQKADYYRSRLPDAPQILVDDRRRNIEQWNAVGGSGVHHRGDMRETLFTVRELIKIHEEVWN